MSQRANYFRLGLFIIAAVAVFIGLVLALSAGQLFRNTVVLETYFNESVQGLDSGSAVKYRGVQLGRVTNITFTFGRYEQDLPRSQRRPYVLVESEVDPALIGFAAESDPERLQQAIERGLRVRIAPVGITGTAYLEIDLVENAPPPLPIDWTPRNLYILGAVELQPDRARRAELPREARPAGRGGGGGRAPPAARQREREARAGADRQARRERRRHDEGRARRGGAAQQGAVRAGARAGDARPRRRGRARARGSRQPEARPAAGGRGGGRRRPARGAREPAPRERARERRPRPAPARRADRGQRRGHRRDARQPAAAHREPARAHREPEALPRRDPERRAQARRPGGK